MFFSLKAGILLSNPIQPVRLFFLLFFIQKLATLQDTLIPVFLPFISVDCTDAFLLFLS